MSLKDHEQKMASVDLEDVQCHVCFHVNTEPLIFLKCKHSFCAGCACRWLSSCSHCPMCRTLVEEIGTNDELKKKATEYLAKHPEHDLPQDLKYEQCVHETVFWSIQRRKRLEDQGAVFFGGKPVPPIYYTEAAEDLIDVDRKKNIEKRLDLLTKRIGEQTPLVQQFYNTEMFNRLLQQNESNSNEEDQEWRMVHGRGLIRVPRSTNRNYCPLRFRRSHSS